MGLRILPFTAHGVLMLSSVLKSERAVQVNIQIMRVFTRLRQMVLYNEELRKEIEELQQITDERFQIIFETLDQLTTIDNMPKKKIGFEVKEKGATCGRRGRNAKERLLRQYTGRAVFSSVSTILPILFILSELNNFAVLCSKT